MGLKNDYRKSNNISNEISENILSTIKIYFLGSNNPASKHYGAGKQYKNYKEVYYKFGTDKKTLYLTFSGPTKLDIAKPNIKSIKKEAKDILSELLSKEKEQDNEISIDILGHSRGGVIANSICTWLLSKPSSIHRKFRLNIVNIADPYAGPLNRRLKNENNDFDKTNDYKIPLNTVVVYTCKENRFRDPAQSLKSKTIVLTDVSHDRTKLISEYIFNYSNEYILKPKNLYVFADPNGKLNEIFVSLKKSNYQNDDLQKKLEQCISSNLKENLLDNTKITQNKDTLNNILNGKQDYINFSYQNISSNGRRELFYTALALIDDSIVKKYLTYNKHTNMWTTIEKHLKKLGYKII